MQAIQKKHTVQRFQKKKKSLRRCLQKYAKSELIVQEKGAWQETVRDKPLCTETGEDEIERFRRLMG